MSNTFTDMTTAPSDAPAATQNVRRKYDSTVARIAGNLLSGVGLRFENYAYHGDNIAETAREAVRWARAIVAEVEKTEPKQVYGANRDEVDWRPRIWPGWITEAILPSGDRVTVWTCHFDPDVTDEDEKKILARGGNRGCEQSSRTAGKRRVRLGAAKRIRTE